VWTRQAEARATTGSLTPHRICYTGKPVMAISKDLLEILVCPLCKATVELKEDGSGLKCVECKRVYPIREDIPVMLIEEARIEE
jgi:uncharacterized protein YbaR (Trm112 family)